MKTVIYHSADFDGIFCREIAKKFLGTEGVNYIGWNFGDAKIQWPCGPDAEEVYVLDLSPECLELAATDSRLEPRLIWIDHHKTSIYKWPSQIPGYRIDGVAACRLAWQWFSVQERHQKTPCCDYSSPADKPYCVFWNPGNKVVQCHNCGEIALPEGTGKYYDRMVSEPLAVRLAGEFDIWDKRDERADVFQYGLRSKELTEEDWQWLLTVRDNTKQGEYALAKTNLAVDTLLKDGRLLQRYSQKQDADLVNYKSFIIEWEGLKFLCLNTGRFNSLTFAAKDIPETGHDALLGWTFTGKTNTVSLYHAKHRTDLDLSKIAVKYGGGGHKGASGFTCEKLPFLN